MHGTVLRRALLSFLVVPDRLPWARPCFHSRRCRPLVRHRWPQRSELLIRATALSMLRSALSYDFELLLF